MTESPLRQCVYVQRHLEIFNPPVVLLLVVGGWDGMEYYSVVVTVFAVRQDIPVE